MAGGAPQRFSARWARTELLCRGRRHHVGPARKVSIPGPDEQQSIYGRSGMAITGRRAERELRSLRSGCRSTPARSTARGRAIGESHRLLQPSALCCPSVGGGAMQCQRLAAARGRTADSGTGPRRFLDVRGVQRSPRWPSCGFSVTSEVRQRLYPIRRSHGAGASTAAFEGHAGETNPPSSVPTESNADKEVRMRPRCDT